MPQRKHHLGTRFWELATRWRHKKGVRARNGKGKRREMDCQTQTHKEEPSSCFLGVVDLACFGLVFSSSLFAAFLVAFLVFFFLFFPPACAFGLVHTGRFCWRGNVLWLVFANAVPRFRPHGFMLSHTATEVQRYR